MSERRSSERCAGAFPVIFRNSVKEYRGVCSDFSSSGLFIITREPFRPGTNIKLQLKVSENENVHLRGVVIRTIKTGDINIKDGMGIKLIEAPHMYHSFLERLDR